MGTIRELYADSIMHEIPFVAYGIHLLSQKDLVDWDMQEEDLSFDHLSFEEINEAIKQNSLNFNMVHLYAAKIDETTFGFILANNLQDATKEYYRVNHTKPIFIVEADGRIDRSMYDEKTKQISTFREIRNQVKKYPFYICDYSDRELTYEEVESEYLRRRETQYIKTSEELK